LSIAKTPKRKKHREIKKMTSVMNHDYIKQQKKPICARKVFTKKTVKNPVAGYAENKKRRHGYTTPCGSPAVLRLSMRFKSCSKVIVSEGAEVLGAGRLVEAGVACLCCFAATEAGTKDIIDVEGFDGDAEGPFTAAFPGRDVGPL
jgi:hypothetical protein